MEPTLTAAGEPFCTDLILHALDDLGIAHEWRGSRREVTRVCSLRAPEPHAFYYAVEASSIPFAALSESVVLCGEGTSLDDLGSNAAIVVPGDVQLAFYLVCQHLFTREPKPGIHASAIVDPAADIDASAEIGPYAVIGGAKIGAGTRVGAHSVIGDACELGSGVVIDAHAHLGATGVAWAWGEDGEKVALPPLGTVHIEDHAFIGSGSVVVRGMLNEVTLVGRGSMLAPGCKLGHGVRLGALTHLANNVALAGSVTVGDRCFLGSGCSVRPHVTLADDTVVGAGAAVVANADEPGSVLTGVPARPRAKNGQLSGIPKSHESSEPGK